MKEKGHFLNTERFVSDEVVKPQLIKPWYKQVERRSLEGTL